MKRKRFFTLLTVAFLLFLTGCSPAGRPADLMSPVISTSYRPGPTNVLYPPERTPLPLWYATDFDYYLSAHANTMALERYELSGKLLIQTTGRIGFDVAVEFDGMIISEDGKEEFLFCTSSDVFGVYDAVKVYYKDGTFSTKHITKANGEELINEIKTDNISSKDVQIIRKTDISFPVSEDDILSSNVVAGDGYTEYSFVKSGRDVRDWISYLEQISISSSASFDKASAETEIHEAVKRLAGTDFGKALISLRINDEGIISYYRITTDYVIEDPDGMNTSVKLTFEAGVREMDESETIKPTE